MTEPSFQPFTDRLSRDIRNDLSESLVVTLQENSLSPSKNVAERYRQQQLANCYEVYIEKRLESYSRALEKIAHGNSDPLYQGLVLWDEQLFFEVHEILEHAWMKAEGEEKLFLQAMIRAAGVYIKLEAGYEGPAERIAAKALPVLQKNKTRLALYTNPDLLITALQKMPQRPPKLL